MADASARKAATRLIGVGGQLVGKCIASLFIRGGDESDDESAISFEFYHSNWLSSPPLNPIKIPLRQSQ
jgi:hypothetical protein